MIAMLTYALLALVVLLIASVAIWRVINGDSE
jgi:hypothetical protein